MTKANHDDLANASPAATACMEDNRHPAPPQVYRAKVYRAYEGDDWIVEPPRNMLSAIDKAVFTGAHAQQLALRHAYERFGNARFFPYSRATR